MCELVKKEIGSDDKFIIFTNFACVLPLIHHVFKDNGINTLTMCGKNTSSSREKIQNCFSTQDDIRGLLMTYRVGGIGITLVKANRVFLFDPWWSPETDDQAFRRAYRIGQEKPVYVYRVLATDTIENHIRDISLGKQEDLAQFLYDHHSTSTTTSAKTLENAIVNNKQED